VVKTLTQSPKGLPEDTLIMLASEYFALAVSRNGTAMTAWGLNTLGSLATGLPNKYQYYPTDSNITVITLQNKKIASLFGYAYIAGILTDTGEVYMWVRRAQIH
jgi:hypothetical protein